MRYWRILLFSTLIVTSTSFAVEELIDKIAAIVNNDVVLKSDVDTLMKLVKVNAEQEDQEFPYEGALRNQILERSILEQILLQIGQKMGIKISDEQLDLEIKNIANQSSMTTDQMLKNLACNGISDSIYRNQIRKDLIISEVRNNEVLHRITILPREIDLLATEIKNQNTINTVLNLSHILISLPKKPTFKQICEAQREAYVLFHQIKKNNPSTYTKGAVRFSSTEKLIPTWEQMGWRNIQDLPLIFIEALKTVKKGDLIGPIRSELGFHILKINDLYDRSQHIFVTEMHVRHILLKPSTTMSDDQARSKLQKIAADIKSGKVSFEDAAKEFSQDPASSRLGGDLGWADPSIYDPPFYNTLMNLKKGQISDPVPSSFGWHLIELIGVRKLDKTRDMHRDRAYRILFSRKFSEEALKWMQEQRANAYVKIF